jgi:NAD(P)H-dependent nitrite reductase small subunit
MYYVLTADKLQRTAPWQEKHEGGIDGIRQIVIDDKLGICAELETRMQYMVNTYECEWKQVVQDPVRRASFKQFVNTDKVEPGIEFVTERGQQRPADWPKAGTGAPWKVKHVNIGYDGIDDGKPHTAMIEIQHANGGAGSQMNMPTSWVQVGAAADFPQDGGAAILHGRSQIAVFNFTSRGEWYASQNFSPKHRTFAMSRGIIGDKAGVPKVADPVAKTNFALTTGECLSGEDMHLLTFRARAEGGMVFVELPPAEMLDMLLNTSDNEIKVDSRITAEMAAMSSGGGVQASGASGTSCGCGSGGKPGGGGGRLDW